MEREEAGGAVCGEAARSSGPSLFVPRSRWKPMKDLILSGLPLWRKRVCVCVCTYVRNSYVYMCIDMYICVRIFKVPVCYLIQDSMREAPLCLPWIL